MTFFFWKNRYQFTHGNEDFNRLLSFEIRGNELLRSQILIRLFSTLTIGILVLSLINPSFFHTITDHGLHIYLILFFVCILVYEIIVRLVIQQTIRAKSRFRLQFLRFGNALEEASIPTIGIGVLAVVYNPADALLGPASYLYFIFILLGTLRLDFRLSVFTGVMSGLQYYVLGLVLSWMESGEIMSPFLSISMISKSLMMAFAGLITGIITLEFKKRIQDTFHAVTEHNRTLEEKVQARTAELEALNRELTTKVQNGIRRRREQEQLIIQQSKMSAMGEMIGMIAHQWRQPLSNIGTLIGNMRVLFELEQLSEAEFFQFVNDINDQTQYLSHTITDFRRFLSTSKELKIVNLDDLIENALKIIGKSLENKNIELRRECRFNKPILTFPNELIQVFINILKNAQDACLENRVQRPTIIIAGEEKESTQILSFQDNAGGIPDTVIDRVFDPYFTTKANTDGTGLGLYMSKTIVETHCQGTLSVENRNGGAHFIIELPHTPPQAPASKL